MARSCRAIRFTCNALAGVAPAQVCGVGVMDRHFKPVEPAAVRVTLSGPLNFDASLVGLPDRAALFSQLPN